MNDLIELLNEKQKQAVLSESQFSLVLAGAGSGKTKTLTTRIIYLIEELYVNPRNILAVTFTNKAANEMKERVCSYSQKDLPLTVKTFHSFGAYILRLEASLAERNQYFQIYDDDDSKKLISEIIKKFDIAKSNLGTIKSWISKYKQCLEDYSKMEYKDQTYLEIYKRYNKALKDANCFDFEDLLLQPVKIFSNYEEVLKKYQRHYQYILIDEYQDTNLSQYQLIKYLVGQNNSLMVVGDEDQSIYRFRGADVSIILNFTEDFFGGEVIKLEENYRSTSNILNLANSVISNNKFRLGKELFTKGLDGDKIILFDCYDEEDEARKIISLILGEHLTYKDTAILYRINNQSRAFESILNKNKIPYTVVGSIAFYEREEIKDAISILKWLVNPQDKIAFERFVNKPVKGIGEKALVHFYEESQNFNNDLFVTMQNIDSVKNLTKKTKDGFIKIYEVFKDKESVIARKTVDELIDYYLDNLGLTEYFKTKDEKENTDKIANIKEFISSIKYKTSGLDTLLLFLEEFSLSASTLKDNGQNTGTVKLMTVHNAKGLEFENIFVSGMESDIFPHRNSIHDEEGLEEERRLFYVAMTRAKRKLFISFCNNRNSFGYMEQKDPSKFLYELKIDYLELKYLSKSAINTLGFKGNKTLSTNFLKKINFQIGDFVRHKDYGTGKIINIKEKNGKNLVTVDFLDYSLMDFVLEFTKLEKLSDR
ncbi:MAG: hypothetical protein A2086_13670 [Spirochaetes bacterium GWD1_27_9]|nr:MAG: hypothetical protein A2Z98_02525 [Spirochaetes bacterium GWB1_27_13]OHD22601.1 MAG: hypothetical protein A2Y34_07490 [Spirochaetes bacterium GWC1_27_15]OHD30707.1 MAG: hypothetical protein A2086_13670 [Spirochaetes bacterium GWD1_27_9]